MTSRERVKRAVLFQKPDRVPWALPERWGTDFLNVMCTPDPSWHPSVQTDTRWEDEWGCIWEKPAGDETLGQVRFSPMDNYAKLASYRFPDYEKKERYEIIKKAVGENKEEKFVLGVVPFQPFHLVLFLRGQEAGWTDPYLYPEQLDKLLDRICEINIAAIGRMADIGVDGILSYDDNGWQDRLMIKPEIWRQVWKPRYKKVYSYARSRGMLTFLHSCGYIIEILGDFIDANLNVIQMDQQENMGVERLSSLFGGKICFWCPVDIQNTMIKGTVEDVKRYARKLIDSFACFNGGFISKSYPQPEAAGHTEEKIQAMCETFVEYGSRFYGKTAF